MGQSHQRQCDQRVPSLAVHEFGCCKSQGGGEMYPVNTPSWETISVCYFFISTQLNIEINPIA